MDFHLWLYPFYSLLLCCVIEGSIVLGAERQSELPLCVTDCSTPGALIQSKKSLNKHAGSGEAPALFLFCPHHLSITTFIPSSCPPLTSARRVSVPTLTGNTPAQRGHADNKAALSRSAGLLWVRSSPSASDAMQPQSDAFISSLNGKFAH